MERAYKTVLINIVKKPLKAFGTIYAFDLYKYQYVFLAIAGMAFTVSRQFYALADTRNTFFFPFVTSVVVGAIFGWVGIGIFSLLIYWTGTWIKGRATSRDIINIMAYASLTNTLILIIGLICIAALRFLGYSGVNYPHVWGNTYYTIIQCYFYLTVIINILYIVLTTLGVSVAQGFSVKKGFFNVLLAALVLIIPITILVIVI